MRSGIVQVGLNVKQMDLSLLFEKIHSAYVERMATGSVTGESNLHKPEREGRKKKATQMRPTKEQTRSQLEGRQTF